MKEPRPWKKEWHVQIFRDVKGYGRTRIVFKAVERTADRKGGLFLLTEIEVETYWTSLPDKPETVIEPYHAHGTSGQLHSELKSDMDVERLPSGNCLSNGTDSVAVVDPAGEKVVCLYDGDRSVRQCAGV